MLQSLVGEKRKVKRNIVVTEAMREGEFNVASAGESGPGLSVSDLLAATSSASAKSARKQLQQLATKGHVRSQTAAHP